MNNTYLYNTLNTISNYIISNTLNNIYFYNSITTLSSSIYNLNNYESYIYLYANTLSANIYNKYITQSLLTNTLQNYPTINYLQNNYVSKYNAKL